jgi:hypothetical protein
MVRFKRPIRTPRTCEGGTHEHLVDATQNTDGYTEVSAMLKVCMMKLSKIATQGMDRPLEEGATDDPSSRQGCVHGRGQDDRVALEDQITRVLREKDSVNSHTARSPS